MVIKEQGKVLKQNKQLDNLIGISSIYVRNNVQNQRNNSSRQRKAFVIYDK